MTKRIYFFLVPFLVFIGGLCAQTEFPDGDYWSLDAGLGMSNLLVRGKSFQFVVDPKLWLSPSLMVGSKIGISYSNETDSRNILTFEGQVYLRWNMLRLGPPQKITDIFIQGGLGLIAAYRGREMPFDDVTMTRGSLMADAALGVTIPLSARWHIEPAVRGGYPHMAGFSVTVGYKFPLPRKTVYQSVQPRTEYVDMVKELPPHEIIKRIMITSVEYILFGPDIGRYNIGIDHDAQGLNELVLNSVAQMLKDNPEYHVRIEGNANPVTTDPKEADELMALGSTRANAVAEQLKARGVNETQMVIISFGGTRTVTHDHEIWNRNRRVELIIIQVDSSQ
jgi:hypothetical protein